MKSASKQITLKLPSEIIIADAYGKTHGLNRNEVFTFALKLLQQQELTQGLPKTCRRAACHT